VAAWNKSISNGTKCIGCISMTKPAKLIGSDGKKIDCKIHNVKINVMNDQREFLVSHEFHKEPYWIIGTRIVLAETKKLTRKQERNTRRVFGGAW